MISLAAFTAEGVALGKRLLELGDCRLCAPARFAGGIVKPFPGTLADWARVSFAEAEGLVVIGACGIAVRAVAPFLQGKDRDPAVVVLDQKGRFVIPILSGHLGGANRLALRIAALCGATPVITTATDVCGAFAVDSWAAEHNVAILDLDYVKTVSSRLLAGKPVGFSCDFPLDAPPDGVTSEPCPVGVSLSLDGEKRPFPITLRLAPRIVYMGIGCRKGVAAEGVEARALAVLREAGIPLQAVAAVCTIDLKAEEPGLLAFCEKHRLPLRLFSARELMAQPGTFRASAFVERTTGTDNVCERAAVAGSGGTLLWPKSASGGVTAALAAQSWTAVFH